MLTRIAPVAVENEADMFGHKSRVDLSTQSALIQPIEDVRHAMTGGVRAGAIEEYVVELVGFAGTKYDDQVDSTTQALDHMREDDVLATYLKAFGRYCRLQYWRNCAKTPSAVGSGATFKRALMLHRGGHRSTR